PLFPAGTATGVSGTSSDHSVASGPPLAYALSDDGGMNLVPARWMTVVSGAQSLTVPVGAQESYRPIERTPQRSGNVVPLGQRLPLAVTLTNLSGSPRAWSVEYLARSASGALLDSGSLSVSLPAATRVTAPFAVGPLDLPGSITVTVVARESGRV